MDTSRVNILLQLSSESAYSDEAVATDYARQAIQLARSINFTKGEIKGLYQLGSVAMEPGNRDTAMIFFEMGMEMARQANDKFLLAQGCYHLSRAYEGKNDFTKAKELLHQALPLYEQLGLQKNVANCYTSFGRICQETGNYSEGLRYYFPIIAN